MEVRARTVVNGALDNPIFAARWPSLVNGDDIVIPSNYEGAFDRNLGGLAADFEAFQGHAQARNPGNPVNTSVNSGGGKTVRAVDTTAGETRPVNYALQWYFIMDDYVVPASLEAGAGGGGGGVGATITPSTVDLAALITN